MICRRSGGGSSAGRTAQGRRQRIGPRDRQPHRRRSRRRARDYERGWPRNHGDADSSRRRQLNAAKNPDRRRRLVAGADPSRQPARSTDSMWSGPLRRTRRWRCIVRSSPISCSLDVMLPGSQRVRARARPETWRKDADHHPVGARREGRQAHGPSSRGRRLHYEAVRHGRAGGAHQYRAAKSEADGRDDPARRRHDRFSKRDRHRPSTAICTSRHREFEILRVLAERSSRVVFRDELFREVWGFLDTSTTRSVDRAVSRLRQKIEADPRTPRFLRTVHGDGYILTPEAVI